VADSVTPAERIKRIYGPGALTRFAETLDLHVNTVSKWNQKGWPQYAIAHLEWLEDTPERYWPERWRRD